MKYARLDFAAPMVLALMLAACGGQTKEEAAVKTYCPSHSWSRTRRV